MARKKDKIMIEGNVPGHIYTRKMSSGKNILYIKSPYVQTKSKTVSTKLEDTKRNRSLAEKKLRELFLAAEYGIEVTSHRPVPTIHQLFEKFIDTRKSRGKSHKNTIANYTYAFRKVFKSDFPVNKSEKREFREIYEIETQIEKFTRNSDIANSSVNIYLRAVRTFVNWLAKQGYINKIDFSEFFLDAEDKPIYAYTESEIETIVEHFANTGKEDIYDFLLFIISSGARFTETLRLRWDQVDFQAQAIYFPKKNRRNKFDKFPISDYLFALLKKLESKAKNRTENQDKVFKWNETAKTYLYRTLNDALKQHGIKREGIVFHSYRKSFITKLFEKDINLVNLKKLARHSDIKTTQEHYIDINNRELKKILDS